MVWIIGLIGGYFAVMLIIAWIFLHPIRTPIFLSPGSMGAPQENIEFESEGLRLRGWWIEAEGATHVMILTHGYLMNRSEVVPTAVELWQRGVSCLVFDFRAHGKSQGRKSFLGVREVADIEAAIRVVRERVSGASIGLLGYSMGAAASAMLCAQKPGIAEVLVLDSGYSRLPSAILGWWRFLGGEGLARLLWPTTILAAPLAGFNPFTVDVARDLAKIGTTPILILHGDRDSLALPSEAKRNFEACAGMKEIVWFAGSGHTEGRWEHPKQYESALFGFLEKVGFLEKKSEVLMTSPDDPRN